MRDRLVDLINEAKDEYPTIPSVNCCKPTFAYYLADRLLANGVIVPPCNIGQPVWRLCSRTVKDLEVCEGKVSMLQQKADKSWRFRISIDSSVYDISTYEIGKTVFLTREEAEQALKGR